MPTLAIDIHRESARHHAPHAGRVHYGRVIPMRPPTHRGVARSHSLGGMLGHMTPKRWGMVALTAAGGFILAHGVSRFVDGMGWFNNYVTADNSNYLRAGISLAGAWYFRSRAPILAIGMGINVVVELVSAYVDTSVDTTVNDQLAAQAQANAAAAANQPPAQLPAPTNGGQPDVSGGMQGQPGQNAGATVPGT
jgi:hypothetical protein